MSMQTQAKTYGKKELQRLLCDSTCKVKVKRGKEADKLLSGVEKNRLFAKTEEAIINA